MLALSEERTQFASEVRARLREATFPAADVKVRGADAVGDILLRPVVLRSGLR
jgi:hypothetical protein